MSRAHQAKRSRFPMLGEGNARRDVLIWVEEESVRRKRRALQRVKCEETVLATKKLRREKRLAWSTVLATSTSNERRRRALNKNATRAGKKEGSERRRRDREEKTVVGNNKARG
jgi:hypothetical protein